MPTELTQTAPTTPFDYAAAAKEGIGRLCRPIVVDCGPSFEGAPQSRLQPIAEPRDGRLAFTEDRDAWAHVVARARAGSALHRAALDAVDDMERMLIEVACGSW